MRHVLRSCFAIVCLSHVCLADEQTDPEFKAVNRTGCKEFWEDKTLPRFLKACTKYLDAGSGSERQRAYAFFVRGTLHNISGRRSEALADFEQSIALNPNFAAVYDWRAGGAGATREALIRDYHKAIELGYRAGGAPLLLASFRLECPSLVYIGNACQPYGGTPAVRYDCDATAQPPPACYRIRIGSPITLFQCEPGFNPGPGCTYSAEQVQLPSAPPPLTAFIPMPPSPPIPSLESPPPATPPPAQPAEKPGWLGWLWGSDKPAEQPPPPPPPPAPLAQAPPLLVPDPPLPPPAPLYVPPAQPYLPLSPAPPAPPSVLAPPALYPVPISTGVQQVLTSSERIAQLRIVTPSGDVNYYLKLVTVSTNTPVLTAYIAGGQSLNIDMPLGVYRLRYATGRTWYGTSALFGEETGYAEADTNLDFYVDGDSVSVLEIQLIKQEGGNLQTRSLGRGEF